MLETKVLAEYGMYITSFYFMISIIIECLHIIFLLTPSQEDDKWIERVRPKWERFSKWLAWVSVKTPLAFMFRKVLSFFEILRKELEVQLEKRRKKKEERKKKEDINK